MAAWSSPTYSTMTPILLLCKYDVSLLLPSKRLNRRSDMFSPILPTRSDRVCSTDLPLRSSDDSAATSAGFCLMIVSAHVLVKSMKSGFFETKSVSQLASNSTPLPPSITATTRPSAAMRPPTLVALLPSFTRMISSARTMSPLASANAFLHSIIGASVFDRRPLTIAAVIVTAPSAAIDSAVRPTRAPNRTAAGAVNALTVAKTIANTRKRRATMVNRRYCNKLTHDQILRRRGREGESASHFTRSLTVWVCRW